MNTERSEEALLRLATAVVDDEAVDWQRLTSIGGHSQRKARNIHLIQSIGEAHRHVREELLNTTTELEPADLPTWGKLRLLQRLGTGGAGSVYRAWDPDLECEVALKLPKRDAVGEHDHGRRFLREARQLAKIRNNNVLRVLGAETHEGKVGIWTELVEGRTLEDLLRQTGRRSADEATSIGVELCKALAAVHAAGLVHRDVKTANVVREEGGRIVLLDFSTAESNMALHDAAQGGALISGTPRFMAPELFRGEPASVESDLYSLGIVLYRLVTVAYPVDADTLRELVAAHERREFRPLHDRRPNLPSTFVHVVERALSAEPSRRFASAAEMEQALESTRHAVPPTAPDTARKHDRPRRWRKTIPWLVAAALLAIAIVTYVVTSPVPLGVELAFYRTASGGLSATIENGAELQPNDTLFFELQTSRDAYVYVIGEDLDGRTSTLFPAPAFEATNPLASDRRHMVPEIGGGWTMNSSSARELLLIVVADRPLVEIEAVMANLRPARKTDATETDMTLRGLGASTHEFKLDGPRILPDLARDVDALKAQDDGIWSRLYDFKSVVEE